MQEGKTVFCGGLIDIGEVKGEGEREGYSQVNTDFQRRQRRDKKVFLREWCKEIEGSNRIGKISNPFKKTTDTKGTFHAKMGSIKDRNGEDLTEEKEINKRWQEYTEELYRKLLVTS